MRTILVLVLLMSGLNYTSSAESNLSYWVLTNIDSLPHYHPEQTLPVTEMNGYLMVSIRSKNHLSSIVNNGQRSFQYTYLVYLEKDRLVLKMNDMRALGFFPSDWGIEERAKYYVVMSKEIVTRKLTQADDLLELQRKNKVICFKGL